MDNSLQFDYFDRFTPSYDDKRIDFAISDLRSLDVEGASLMDLGCGDGSLLEYVRRQVGIEKLSGLDPAAAYVDQARAKGLDVSVGSILEPADLERFAGTQDFLILASVLHHLVGKSFPESRRNAVTAISNALRLLRPGGRLYIFEPCYEPGMVPRVGFYSKALVIRLGGNRRIGPGMFNIGAPLVAFFTRAELEDTVTAAGGRVLRRTPVDESTTAGFIHRRRTGLVVTTA